MRKTKTEKGITLVALIITIVVLLILAVVAISAIQNDGILRHATNATNKYNQAVTDEQTMLNEYQEYLNSLPTGNGEPKEYIGTTTSFIGYYVDMDGNVATAPEGVIYADLALDSEAGANWNGYTYSWTAETASDLKNYYKLAESWDGPFGEAPVLTTDGTGGAKERFYVMALTDFIKTEDEADGFSAFAWYTNAYENADASVTSTDFGTGKTNTAAMMNTYYGHTDWGTESDDDVWKNIESEVNNGWFVPSKDEWSAFAKAFNLTGANHSTEFGLYAFYWSSSLGSNIFAYATEFDVDGIGGGNIDSVLFALKLSAMF